MGSYIADDVMCQTRWRLLAVMAERYYDTLGGKVGHPIVQSLSNKISGLWSRSCKVEWFIIFQMMILQRAPHVTASHEIQWHIKKHLDSWDSRQHQIMVGETDHICNNYLSKD